MKEKLKKWGKRIFSGSLKLLWALILAGMAMGLFTGMRSIVVRTMEKEQTQRIHGSAQRDALAVQSTIEKWKQNVADWANAVRGENHATLKEVVEAAALGNRLMGSNHLYLVDNTFYFYDNLGLIAPKPEYASVLQNMEGASLLLSGKEGTILVCWKLKPFSVEYNQFTHVVAEFSTAALREILRNTIYGEETYCGVLDAGGHFLVDGIEDGKSFYGVMDRAKIQGYASAKDLRNAVQRREPMEVACKLSSGDNILITTPLPEIGWTLMTIHPAEPVDSLKNPILLMCLVLCLLMAAAVVATLAMMQQTRREYVKRKQAQKHSEELQEAFHEALERIHRKEAEHSKLSHDILTDLTSILGYSTLVKRHRREPDLVREFIWKIEEASEQIRSILEPNWIPQIIEEVQTPEQAPLDITGKRILLVEDNELNREMGEVVLTEAGMIVECAENGQIGFQKVATSKPGSYYDLVLMDIQMPVMDGLEAARTIRRLRSKRLAEIPILALTASVSPEDKQRAFEAGMDGYVEKPMDVDKLIRAIRNALSRGFAG